MCSLCDITRGSSAEVNGCVIVNLARDTKRRGLFWFMTGSIHISKTRRHLFCPMWDLCVISGWRVTRCLSLLRLTSARASEPRDLTRGLSYSRAAALLNFYGPIVRSQSLTRHGTMMWDNTQCIGPQGANIYNEQLPAPLTRPTLVSRQGESVGAEKIMPRCFLSSAVRSRLTA